MEFKPRAYQPPAIAHLQDVPFAALWAGMGLGKTVSALTTTWNLIDRLQVRRTLVIAPLRVARRVWAQEASKWDHLSHLRVQLIRHKDPQVRLRQALSEADVHVINFDNLVWLVKALDGKWPWDHVIVDEASKIKDPGSWRSRALWHVRPKIRHLKELTGTPAGSGLIDVYGQVLMLDRGERLGKTAHQYKQRWFRKLDFEGRKWEPKEGAFEHIVETCRDICFSLRAEDYFDLPPLIVNDIPVHLPAKLMERYAKLEKELYLQLEAGAIDAANAAVVTGKCQQFANGAVWAEVDGKREWAQVHDAKLEALAEVIESAQGEPVLVAYWFKPELEKLKKAFPQGEVLDDSQEVEDRWNAGKIPVLFAQYMAASHGLNLQWGGRHLALFSLVWSLELYEQIIERIGPTRQFQAGLDRPVHVHRIVAEGTIDEAMVFRLENNASVQDALKLAMRRR